MGSSTALFTPVGDRFQPSELTRGGWSDRAQHGGPPTALLARAIEAVDTAQPMMVTRMTIDLMREVPLTPLAVDVDVVRGGRRIQLVDATLHSADAMVARATALKIRIGNEPVPPQPSGWRPPPPEACRPFDWASLHPRWGEQPRYHMHAIEIRTADGSFSEPGTGVSWFRLTHPVVAGEDPSPFVRLAAVADMGNGNSQRLDGRSWLYINPDITLYLHALPTGEWIGMRSTAHQHTTGIGVAATQLFDEQGPIGWIGQAQLIERRQRS